MDILSSGHRMATLALLPFLLQISTLREAPVIISKLVVDVYHIGDNF